MTRVCFQLQVRPDRLDEYRARHAEVEPAMLAEIAASGRTNYSLFLRADGLLIGYYESDDVAASAAYLDRSAVADAWEQQMAPYFAATKSLTDAGGRADQGALALDEIFNLDDQLVAATGSSARSENS